MSLAHQIFVSHATEDLDTAQRVCKILEGDGISCWLATRDVEAGTDYAAAILDAIKNSSLVLLTFSKYANTSPYVLREIERAIAYERPVLSLRIDDAVPNPSMEYYLNLWQWLDAQKGVEKQRQSIVTAVQEQLEGAGARANGSEKAPATGTGARAVPTRMRRRTVLGIAIAAVLVVAIAAGIGTWAMMHHSGTQASSSLSPSTTDTGTTSTSVLAFAHNSWTELSPTGTLPTARARRAMAWDPSSSRLIIFGGGGDDLATYFNDTWAYDPVANTWTNLSPSGAIPSARQGASMVYDPSTRSLIMFGGETTGGGSLNDTWAYDPTANTWTNLSPSGKLPYVRDCHSMVYDPQARRVILFGGMEGATNFAMNDTWAYDPVANTWTNLRTPEPLPSRRTLQSMAYDPTTPRMIMFGGWSNSGSLNDTWAYDPSGNTWSKLSPSGTLPYARQAQSMVYDPLSGLMIMFGGVVGYNGLRNDTWTYDPTTNTWSELSPPGTLPTGRSDHAMVYDPSGGRMIMFGGDTSTGVVNDTWIYTP
jgi:N-acetylneuraminic acid mutarotase